MTRLLPTAFRIVRQVPRRAVLRSRRPHGLILMYHRIGFSAWDPWQIAVSSEHFEQHLAVLVRMADIVPLTELGDRLRVRNQGRPIVALTFDDGYADNFHKALPLLEQFGVPATVFVATGWIGRDEPFWWDRLTQIVRSLGEIPAEIRVPICESEFVWRRHSASPDREKDRDVLHQELWRHLLYCTEEERDLALRELGGIAGVEILPDPNVRPMDEEEIASLARSGLVEIGSHTRTHCSLPDIPRADRFDEIHGSRDRCRELTGLTPSSFAYPFGRWDRHSMEQVRLAGFSRACAGNNEIYWQGTDPFALPRTHVRDLDGDAFARRLRWAWLP